MLYPIYVHRDGTSAYGATFPDIPGCFTAADSLEDLPRMAQEAVEVHFEGEDEAVPPPGDLARLKDDPDFTGGFWLLVDIDLTRVNAQAVRLNISLPANLVQRIDQYAADNHMTRSGFLASAAVNQMDGETRRGIVAGPRSIGSGRRQPAHERTKQPVTRSIPGKSAQSSRGRRNIRSA